MFGLRKKEPTPDSYRAGVEAAYGKAHGAVPTLLGGLTKQQALGHLGRAILAVYDSGTRQGYSPEKKHKLAEGVVGAFASKSGERYGAETVKALIEAALEVRAHRAVQTHRGQAATA